MKRKLTLLLLAAGSLFKLNSQVLINENFTATWTPSANNWVVENLSTSPGTLDWFQGNSSVFSAYNGGPNDYFAANFNAQAATQGGISDWLITPTVTIYNGAVFQFATRIPNTATVIPDGLELRMSTSGSNTTIPTGTTSVGPFTNLLLAINPLLSTSTASAVSNGSVNGYPNAWTVYSVQISGVTGTVTGRFAFRYVVDDGGPNGANSDYIGIDAVKYTLPCGPTVQSYTTCANASTTLQAMGIPATTYSWNTGATTSSIVVSPSVSTTYTLYPSNGATSCGTMVTAAITVSSNLSVYVSASSNTVCSGGTVTLTASGAATNYTWAAGALTNTIGTGAVITVTPSGTSTTYSVAGLNGFCAGGNSVTINTLPNPTVHITSASTLLCVGGASTPVTFTGNGASNYVWVLGSASTTGSAVILNVAAQSNTTPAVQSLTLGMIGIDANGCISTDIFTLTIEKTPTITVTSNTAHACTNSTVTITAAATNSSSVASYSWSGAGTGTANPITVATGSVAGTKTVTVIAMSADGCTTTANFTQSVVVCNVNTVGIPVISGYEETAIFPNPFVNEIKVNVLDGHVIVFNALGQAVMNVPVHSSETLSTTELPKGVYLVKAFNTNGELVKTVKLIKN